MKKSARECSDQLILRVEFGIKLVSIKKGDHFYLDPFGRDSDQLLLAKLAEQS